MKANGCVHHGRFEFYEGKPAYFETIGAGRNHSGLVIHLPTQSIERAFALNAEVDERFGQVALGSFEKPIRKKQ